MAYSHINRLFYDGTTWPFSKNGELTLPIVMTFAGSYLFNFGMLVRRLYVLDLSDNLFWGSINRLLLSMGIALTSAVAFSSTAGKTDFHKLLLFFFAIPFILNKVLYAILRAGTAQAGSVLKISALGNESSLQQVGGINIWKEYRLEEEGVEDVQNLSTADVIELAVKTHYNLRTLIDWIDQGIVLTRLPGKVTKMRDAGVNISAIELAQQSPENGGSEEYVTTLANILDIKEEVMKAQMNAMFEDEYIQTLWTLWQTRDETQLGVKAMTA